MILVGGPSSVSGDQWLTSLNQPDRGVISLVPVPGSHAFWVLESAFLARLGQSEGAQGSTQNDRVTLGIWVEAYNITDVILNHADHYSAAVLVDLNQVLIEAGAKLWLVVEPALLERIKVDLGRSAAIAARMDWIAFLRAWGERSTPVREPMSRCPDSVDSERALRNGVAPGRRTPATGTNWPYLAGFCAIANDTAQLRARDDAPEGAPASPHQSRMRLAARLRSLSTAYSDRACFEQAVRGSAPALRRIGWTVTVDDRHLAAASDGLTPDPVDAVRLGRMGYPGTPSLPQRHPSPVSDLRLTRSPKCGYVKSTRMAQP